MGWDGWMDNIYQFIYFIISTRGLLRYSSLCTLYSSDMYAVNLHSFIIVTFVTLYNMLRVPHLNQLPDFPKQNINSLPTYLAAEIENNRRRKKEMRSVVYIHQEAKLSAANPHLG